MQQCTLKTQSFLCVTPCVVSLLGKGGRLQLRALRSFQTPAVSHPATHNVSVFSSWPTCTTALLRKGKAHPLTGHEGPEGKERYSSTLSLTSALDVGGWSTPRPGRFTTAKETRYPLYRRLGGPQERSGEVRKISPPPPGFDPRTVQPVASRYTD